MSGSSEYIWYVNLRDGRTSVVVLAWHEGKATVIEVDQHSHIREGTSAYLVRLSDLRFGRPPETATVSA